MKVVILSREPESYSTKRLMEAAEQAGHMARIIDHTKCYVNVEQNKPSIYYEGELLTGIDIIIPRIGQSVTSYGAAVIRQFEMMRTYTVTSSLALVRSRDKLRGLQLLARAGIGIPKTAFARQGVNAEGLIGLVGGAPVVVKLLEGTQGRGVVLAETRKAGISVIEAFHNLKASFLVQEFIDEAGGSDIRVIVVGGQVVGAMLRQASEGEFRSNLHRGGTSVPVELTPKERRIAISAVETLGLKVAGVDIIRSERGPLVLEVNSSPGLQGIESVVGRHVADDIIAFAVREATGKRRKDKIGA